MANKTVSNICEKVTGHRKLCDRSTEIPCQSQGALTGSTKNLTEGLQNLKTLSTKELLKIAEEEEPIGKQLTDQLERKHRRELLHHLLRQKEEMQELEKNRNTAIKSDISDVGKWTGVSSVSSQPTSLSSLLMSQVPEEDEKCEEAERVNALNVPPQLEFSNMGAEIPVGDNGGNIDVRLLEENQKIVRLLRDFSLDVGSDAELGSRLQGMQHKNKDVLLNQPARIDGTRVTKCRPQKKVQQNRQSANIEPTKFNKSFKTKVCRRLAEFGNCSFGESCPFPHGAKELRMQEMKHKNFKTVWCKKFLAGYCPYGPRCCFIHHVSEKRIRAPSGPSYLPPGRNFTPNGMGTYGNEFGAYVPNGMYSPNGAFPPRPPSLSPGRNLTPNWMGMYGNEFGAYAPNGMYPPNGAFPPRHPSRMDLSRFSYCSGRHPMVFNRPYTW